MKVIDLIGYTALVFNLISMTRANVIRLRQLSVIANAIYVLYGFLIHAYPVIIGCTIAVILHTHHLIRIKKGAKNV